MQMYYNVYTVLIDKLKVYGCGNAVVYCIFPVREGLRIGDTQMCPLQWRLEKLDVGVRGADSKGWSSSEVENQRAVLAMILGQAVAPHQQIRDSGVRLFGREMRPRPLLESQANTPWSYWRIACDLEPVRWVATRGAVSGTRRMVEAASPHPDLFPRIDGMSLTTQREVLDEQRLSRERGTTNP